MSGDPASLRRAAVVVPTHNSRGWVEGCLGALRMQQGVSLQVVVVDNASSDDTVALVRRLFREAEVVELPENAGYAGALCAGERRAEPGRPLLALNVDTVGASDAVARLLDVLDARPAVGVVAPRLENPDGSLQPSIQRFPSVGRFALQALRLEQLGRSPPDHARAQDVDWATGAALLVRREAWDAVGGFDPAYRFYVEEIDFQRRVRDAGWQVAYEPAAVVVHHGGFTPVPPERFLLSHDGFERYFGVHDGRTAQVLGRLALCLVAASRWAAWSAIAATSARRRPAARAWAAMFGPVTLRSLAQLPRAARRTHDQPMRLR